MTDVATVLIVILLGLGGAAVTVAWMWRTLERSQSTDRARLDRQDLQIEDLQQQVHQLHMERIADRAFLERYSEWGRQGWAEWSKLSGQPAPPEPEDRPRPIGQADIVRLGQLIAERFSAGEINSLAFDLGLSGQLTGETTGERARTLVDVARRRGLILKLINLCRQQNPAGGF